MEKKNTSDEFSVNLRDLLCAVLLKWRLLLLAGVLFAGVYALYTMRPSGGSSAPAESEQSGEASLQMDQYKANMAALDLSIAGLRELLAEANSYLSESVLMKIRPYSKAVSRGTAEIRAGSGDPADLAHLTDMAIRILKDYDTLSEMADELGTEPKYISELISVEVSRSGSGQNTVIKTGDEVQESDSVQTVTIKHEDITDTGGHAALISIETIGTDEETAHMLYEKAGEMLKERFGEDDRVKSGTVEISSAVTTVEIDRTLFAKQAEAFNQVTSLNKSLQNALDESRVVEKPETASDQGKSAGFSLKKTAAAGLAGILAAAVLFAFLFVVSPSVRSGDDIRRMFGIRCLGDYGTKTAHKLLRGVDRAVIRFVRGESERETGETDALIAQGIRNLAEGKKVLVTGSGNPGDISSFAGNIRELLMKAGSETAILCEPGLGKRADAAKAAAESDAVLLAEAAGKASVREVKEEIECARDAGADVLGYVLL